MKLLYAAVLNEDGTVVTRTSEQAEEKQAHLLDQLLPVLLQRRASMRPPPSQETQGRELQVMDASSCSLSLDLAGNVAMTLYHPALGLLSWELPRQLAQDLATKLQSLLDEEDLGPPQ
jgi:hypothetical protein